MYVLLEFKDREVGLDRLDATWPGANLLSPTSLVKAILANLLSVLGKD